MAYEKVKIYRSADCVCAHAIRDGCSCTGVVPEDGHQRCDLLQSDEEVWRFRGNRAAGASTAQGRKCAAQTDGRRFEPGPSDAAGCHRKKR